MLRRKLTLQMTDTTLPRRKAHCNQCGGSKQHDVLWTKSEKLFDDYCAEGTDHFGLQCRGCESISYETSGWQSDLRDEDGELLRDVQSYPPKTVRKKPHWHADVVLQALFDDKHFLNLLDEIYIALQNNCPRIAVMGIRALVETIMVDKCGDQRTFADHLDAFEKQGYMSTVQRRAIEPVIEAGHATIHRSFKPDAGEVLIALNIAENLIESIYVAGTLAAQLKVPPRKRPS